MHAQMPRIAWAAAVLPCWSGTCKLSAWVDAVLVLEWKDQRWASHLFLLSRARGRWATPCLAAPNPAISVGAFGSGCPPCPPTSGANRFRRHEGLPPPQLWTLDRIANKLWQMEPGSCTEIPCLVGKPKQNPRLTGPAQNWKPAVTAGRQTDLFGVSVCSRAPG